MADYNYNLIKINGSILSPIKISIFSTSLEKHWIIAVLFPVLRLPATSTLKTYNTANVVLLGTLDQHFVLVED